MISWLRHKVSITYSHVGKAQSCANHVQHMRCLSHATCDDIGIPLATLSDAWCFRVSGRPHWPSVGILSMGDISNLTCNFCLSLTACKLSLKINSARNEQFWESAHSTFLLLEDMLPGSSPFMISSSNSFSSWLQFFKSTRWEPYHVQRVCIH